MFRLVLLRCWESGKVIWKEKLRKRLVLSSFCSIFMSLRGFCVSLLHGLFILVNLMIRLTKLLKCWIWYPLSYCPAQGKKREVLLHGLLEKRIKRNIKYNDFTIFKYQYILVYQIVLSKWIINSPNFNIVNVEILVCR